MKTTAWRGPIGGGDGTIDAVADRVIAEIAQRGFLTQDENARPRWGGPFYRDVPSSTPSTPLWAGPNSLFGALGLERDVISLRVAPYGLAERLPVQMTNVEWPQFAYFTGFQMGQGIQPNGPCDDPPTPGPGATCIQTAQFGRVSYQTRVLDISNMNRIINRAEMRDLNLLNGPFIGGPGGITTPPSIGDGFNIYNEARMRMEELAPLFQQWFGRMVYEGNPANNTGGNGYREFPGLDILVNTGHTDAVTGTTCTQLDSVLIDWNSGNVTTDNSEVNRMIDLMTKLMRYMRLTASAQNLDPVQWVWVMRPGLFYELTAAWPCNYATYRCASATGANGANVAVNVDGMDMAQMRDAMRNGQYLIMDGQQMPVILDNTIRETSVSGGFKSDVWLLPLSVRGGYSTLYWEVFNFSESLGDAADMLRQAASVFYWTDGGRYFWHVKPPNNWCVQIMALIKPRLIFRTPHLAARLMNVAYQTPWHEPDPFLGDAYNVYGGVLAGRAAPTFSVNLGGWTSVS